jgi:hypothetical protein
MNNNSCVASFLVVTLVVLLVAPAYAQGIAPSPDLWRSFAQNIEPGKTVKVRLMTGQRFKATLLQVSTDGMTVQPRTRAPVPPQVVPFDQVASLEIDTSKGASLAKAIGVGAAVAAGTFFGLMLLTFAVIGD